jgi:hypothetical protein
VRRFHVVPRYFDVAHRCLPQNQNFPAPRLPVASHLQAIATLLEAAPPASSTLLTQLRTIWRALDRSRAPEYAQTAIDYLDRLAGTIDGIQSLPPKSTA